jgi:hypothetical protein
MVAALPRAPGDDRLVWLCVDFARPELQYSLDCAHDLLDFDRNGKREYRSLLQHMTILTTMLQYAIYQSSIDYQTAAYGPYAASATGGNDLARDFMAGVAAMYSTPLYKNIPGRPM